MGKALDATGQLVDMPVISDADRAAAKTRADTHRATKQAARDQATKHARLSIPPTQDPKVRGALWNNNGTPAISAG